jgi:hypothetical protein
LFLKLVFFNHRETKKMPLWFWMWQMLLIVIMAVVFISCVLEMYFKSRDVQKLKKEKEEEEANKPQKLTSRILFTRNFANTNGTNEVTDSLLDYISNIDTVSQLKYTSFYVMDTDKEFEVHRGKQIAGQVFKVVMDETTGTIKMLSFYLQSYCLSITELREWVNDVHSEYTVNQNNELGSRRYFFNQLPEKQQRGDKRLHLSFDMSQFETTKTLDNLYGDHIDKVQSRIELFQNKHWYQRNGVPHTLGILLYGEPGCGKTSLIKAIAHDTNRHVFNIRLADTMTKEQLSHLFFDPKVHVRNKETNSFSVITIPLNQRLYVLEDIDCAENTVLSRAFLQSNDLPVTLVPNVPQFAQGMFGERELDMIKEQVNNEKDERIDLAFLLNILDGVLETPQRLIVMTTNYPSKLDAALLRPGRIDLMLEFRKCSVEMLLTMVQNFYEDEVNTSSLLDERLNELLTPAEVQEVLCNFIDDAEGAVKQIMGLARKAQHLYCLSELIPVTLSESPETSLTINLTEFTQPEVAQPEFTQPEVAVETPLMNVAEPKVAEPEVAVETPLMNVASRIPRMRKTENTTTFLPCADAIPEPRRESKWLKYQM